MAWSTLSRFAFVLSVPVLAVACVVDSSSPGYAGTASGSAGGGGGLGGSTTATGAPSAHPILAPIDTNQTMTAAPGLGVGVFTEYDSGGLWHIWWTCDGLVDSANPPCQFDVKVSVQTGTITGVTQTGFGAADTFTQVSSTEIEGATTTSTGMSGFDFQTTPGTIITLSATVGGQYDGRFIFFVEGGKVDDGFRGTVTDPIKLQGAQP